jgi:hypothetical protein
MEFYDIMKRLEELESGVKEAVNEAVVAKAPVAKLDTKLRKVDVKTTAEPGKKHPGPKEFPFNKYLDELFDKGSPLSESHDELEATINLAKEILAESAAEDDEADETDKDPGPTANFFRLARILMADSTKDRALAVRTMKKINAGETLNLREREVAAKILSILLPVLARTRMLARLTQELRAAR